MDAFLHALIGFALYVLPALAAPGFLSWRMALACGITAAGAGLVREWWQHRKKPPVWNLHRVIEGLAWGAGAALGGLL